MRLPDFEGWAVFAKVVEVGSFTGAAADLGLSKGTVSKLVSRLEERIGSRLFHRTSRTLALTEAGRTALEGAARILAEGEATEARASAAAQQPKGRVRLAAPMSFGVAQVASRLPVFFQQYPTVTVDMHLSDDVVDLVGAGFDIGLRIAALARLVPARAPHMFCPPLARCHPPPTLIGMVVPSIPSISPATLASATRTCRSRIAGDSSVLTARWPWWPRTARCGPIMPRALTPMLRAGLGLAVQPEFMIWDDLVSGRLVRCDVGLVTTADRPSHRDASRRAPPRARHGTYVVSGAGAVFGTLDRSRPTNARMSRVRRRREPFLHFPVLTIRGRERPPFLTRLTR